MSIERVRKYLQQFGRGDDIIETAASSATVVFQNRSRICQGRLPFRLQNFACQCIRRRFARFQKVFSACFAPCH